MTNPLSNVKIFTNKAILRQRKPTMVDEASEFGTMAADQVEGSSGYPVVKELSIEEALQKTRERWN